jgi:hypothetical protein
MTDKNHAPPTKRSEKAIESTDKNAATNPQIQPACASP